MALSAPSPAREPVTRFSALPGCYIFGLLACMVVGLIVWGVYTFTRQARQLEGFTATAAAALSIREPSEAEVVALREKLTGFQKGVEAGQAVSLTLSVDELNNLLAGFSSLAEIRPLLTCREIDADGRLVAEVSLPLNSLSGRRFLNGSFICKVGAHEEVGLYIAVTDIQVPGKSVPQGFIDVYQRGILPGKTFGFLDDTLLRNFRADPVTAAAMGAIKVVSSTEGSLTLSTKPKTTPGADGAVSEESPKNEAKTIQ